MADILSEYLTRSELARQIGKSLRTVFRMESRREGPPITYIGRTPYYHRESVRDWLKKRERKPVKRAGTR